jgi:hypothetical protein
MSVKTIQLSVRISEADAEFLADLEVAGAQTPSEKLRHLIAEARARRDQGRSYEAALGLVRDLLEPVAQTLRARELVTRQRSEMISDTLYWLPDLVAFLIAGPGATGVNADGRELVEFEAGVAHRIFRFTDAMLRLAVTSKAPCYNPDVVATHMGGTLELAKLVLEQSRKTAPAA